MASSKTTMVQLLHMERDKKKKESFLKNYSSLQDLEDIKAPNHIGGYCMYYEVREAIEGGEKAYRKQILPEMRKNAMKIHDKEFPPDGNRKSDPKNNDDGTLKEVSIHPAPRKTF